MILVGEGGFWDGVMCERGGVCCWCGWREG